MNSDGTQQPKVLGNSFGFFCTSRGFVSDLPSFVLVLILDLTVPVLLSYPECFSLRPGSCSSPCIPHWRLQLHCKSVISVSLECSRERILTCMASWQVQRRVGPDCVSRVREDNLESPWSRQRNRAFLDVRVLKSMDNVRP